jgi:1-pyrroline-5-carboxylate dehydrogenase
MGNTVLWKPSTTAKPAAHFIMALLQEAGLPNGVINLVYGDGAQIAQQALSDRAFAGLHFTGSSRVAFRRQVQRASPIDQRYE